MINISYIPSKASIHQMTGNYLNGFQQIQSGKKLDIIVAVAKIASYILFAGTTYISAYVLWLATKPNLTISLPVERETVVSEANAPSKPKYPQRDRNLERRVARNTKKANKLAKAALKQAQKLASGNV